MKRAYGLLLGCAMMTVTSLSAQAQGRIAPMILEGIKTLHLSGSIDDNGSDFGMGLNGSAGVFARDFIETGVFAKLGFRGNDHSWGEAGVYGERYFPIDLVIVPFAGSGIGLGWQDTVASGSDVYLELTGYAGARYFFANYAAFRAELAVSWASASIYNSGEDVFDWGIRIGTSWYF